MEIKWDEQAQYNCVLLDGTEEAGDVIVMARANKAITSFAGIELYYVFFSSDEAHEVVSEPQLIRALEIKSLEPLSEDLRKCFNPKCKSKKPFIWKKGWLTCTNCGSNNWTRVANKD